jgi:alkyldihydroxyacetonephosphate synthase
MIAYLRDYAFDYACVAESFETSAPWDKVSLACKNVKLRIEDECQKRGVKIKPWISYRVTQLYETGAAIYVYFAFVYHGLPDPVRTYSEVEDAARDEIMKCGGSISHHHGNRSYM